MIASTTRAAGASLPRPIATPCLPSRRRGPASPRPRATTTAALAAAAAPPSPARATSRDRRLVAACPLRPHPARRSRPTVTASAASSLFLPPQYGLVLASLASTAALLQWLAIRVALARREYGVDYPKMYADDGTEAGKTFDCIQRAHQNTLETAPAQMVLISLLGLAHPGPAAAAQAAWVAGRVVYALGYSTGDPKARLPGVAVAGLVYVGTIAAALFEGARLVLLSSGSG